MSTTNSMGLGSDMPIGLGMLLMEDQLAFSRFGAMSLDEKKQIIKYVESGVAVKCLHDGVPGFYLM